jgi:Na+/melibiose symporter-like transporter
MIQGKVTHMVSAPPARSITRNRDFLLLWAGEGISLAGSQITELALPLTAVISLGAGAGEMGLLGLARFAPYLLVTLPAGLIADRYRRRPILLWANVGRAVLIGLVPMLALLGWLRIEHLYAIAFAAGTLTVFFDVTYWSFLPVIVEKDQLTEGNSRLMATQSIATIGGPGLGGALVQLLTAPIALLIDAVSFLVSAASLALIRRPEPRPEPAAEVDDGVGARVREGFALVLGNPILRALVGTAGAYNLFNAWIEVLFVILAVQVLGLTPVLLGLVLSSGAAGALVGALLAAPLARRIGIGPAVVWTVVLDCVAMLPIALVGGPTWVVLIVLFAAFFFNGFGVSLSSVHAISLRQTVTPHRLLGRMTATYRLIGYGGISIGALVGGLAGELLGVRLGVLLGSIGMLSAATFVIFSPLRRLHRMPQESLTR